jgi:hypothetical protein
VQVVVEFGSKLRKLKVILLFVWVADQNQSEPVIGGHVMMTKQEAIMVVTTQAKQTPTAQSRDNHLTTKFRLQYLSQIAVVEGYDSLISQFDLIKKATGVSAKVEYYDPAIDAWIMCYVTTYPNFKVNERYHFHTKDSGKLLGIIECPELAKTLYALYNGEVTIANKQGTKDFMGYTYTLCF